MNEFSAKRGRGALDGDLSIWAQRKILSQRFKQLPKLRLTKNVGGATAEINRIELWRKDRAQSACERLAACHISTDAVNVTLHSLFRKNIRCEIAVAAFRAAEGHRNIGPERHSE